MIGEVVAALLVILIFLRERAHDQERSLLLNRIQAPETAVAQTLVGPPVKQYLSEADEDEMYANV